jgi:hypothetical protein
VIYGVSAFVAALSYSLIGIETKDKKLPETIEDMFDEN